MKNSTHPVFITGIRKLFLYARIATHVIAWAAFSVLKGKMKPGIFFPFIYRAFLFLQAVRHNKVVRWKGCYKLHLYIPAYPSKAFFYTLQKFIQNDPGPLTVVLSITKACSYACPHCYQKKDGGKDMDEELMIQTALRMQDVGVSMFDIEGGDPMLRFDRLVRLIKSLDNRAEIWLNTTGTGVTEEKVDQLADAGLAGVMVSLHSPDEKEYDAFTGVPGAFKSACESLRLFSEKGVMTAVNCCPSPDMVVSGGFDKLMDLSKKLRCSYVQAIHGKSAGGWLGKTDEFNVSEELISLLRGYHLKYNSGGRFLDYPSLSAQVFEESEEVFGCTAGGVDRFYLGADGELQPCEFLNISFGNVSREDFRTVYSRMRSFFRSPGMRWLCCAEAASIDRIIKEKGLSRTPIPWEITKTFIGQWDKGCPTPLYRKLGIYR